MSKQDLQSVDAILAEWGITGGDSISGKSQLADALQENQHLRRQVEELTKHGRVLVEANARHFNACQDAYKENARLQLELTQLRDDLADSRKRGRKVLLAIKSVLGLGHWPDIKGDFVEGVIILLKAHDSLIRAQWNEAVEDRDRYLAERNEAYLNDPRWRD